MLRGAKGTLLESLDDVPSKGTDLRIVGSHAELADLQREGNVAEALDHPCALGFGRAWSDAVIAHPVDAGRRIVRVLLHEGAEVLALAGALEHLGGELLRAVAGRR